MRSYENDTVSAMRNAIRQPANWWRRANIAFSIRHVPGLLQEVGIRALTNKIGPMSYLRGRRVYEDAIRASEDATYAKANPKAALNAERLRAMAGGTVTSATEDLARHVSSDQLWGTKLGSALDKFRTVAEKKVTGAPLRAVKEFAGAYGQLTTGILKYQRAIFEKPSEIAGLGKHMNDEAKAITGKSLPVIKKMQGVQAQIAKGVLDPKALDAAARALTEYWGNWSSTTPAMKNAMSVSPFVNWYVNSLKFIYHTLPVHHPIKTGLMVALEGATAEQRKAEGQGYEGIVPHPAAKSLAERQQGSVPVGNGFVANQEYYTPAGAVSGGLEGALNALFPYASDPWAILHGTNPLTGKTLENSKYEPITSAEQKVHLALLSMLESFVPPVRIGKELAEKGKPEDEDPLGKALGISPQVWKVFRPFRTEKAYTQEGKPRETGTSNSSFGGLPVINTGGGGTPSLPYINTGP
jgi:hypothetical protein